MINEKGALEQLPYESQTPQRHQQTTHPGETISHSRCGFQNIGTEFEIPDYQESRQLGISVGIRVVTPCYVSGTSVKVASNLFELIAIICAYSVLIP